MYQCRYLTAENLKHLQRQKPDIRQPACDFSCRIENHIFLAKVPGKNSKGREPKGWKMAYTLLYSTSGFFTLTKVEDANSIPLDAGFFSPPPVGGLLPEC